MIRCSRDTATSSGIHISGKGPAVEDAERQGTACGEAPIAGEHGPGQRPEDRDLSPFGRLDRAFRGCDPLAKLVDHPNLGVSFNLCHCLATGDEARIPALLADARPVLYTATICGADRGPPRTKSFGRSSSSRSGRGRSTWASSWASSGRWASPARSVFRATVSSASAAKILVPTIAAWRRFSAGRAAKE